MFVFLTFRSMNAVRVGSEGANGTSESIWQRNVGFKTLNIMDLGKIAEHS